MVEQENGEILTRLAHLLEAGRWLEANLETRKIILKIASQEKEGYLTDEKIQQFPVQDLRKIDVLWNNYSNGKFGFRVQKRIMRESKKDPKVFGQCVGWRDQDGWISPSRVIYNPITAPEGHLPWGIIETITTMDNAALNTFVDTLRSVTKALVKQDWQRQVIADFMAFGGFFIGDHIDKQEFKRSMEYELSHDEAWWQGQRVEELKVTKLFSFLVNL